MEFLQLDCMAIRARVKYMYIKQYIYIYIGTFTYCTNVINYYRVYTYTLYYLHVQFLQSI